MNQQNNNLYTVIFIIVVIFVCIASAFNGGPKSSSNYVPSSVDYNYAKSRMRAEGYSEKDADAAARAIMKFHQAQQNR